MIRNWHPAMIHDWHPGHKHMNKLHMITLGLTVQADCSQVGPATQ